MSKPARKWAWQPSSKVWGGAETKLKFSCQQESLVYHSGAGGITAMSCILQRKSRKSISISNTLQQISSIEWKTTVMQPPALMLNRLLNVWRVRLASLAYPIKKQLPHFHRLIVKMFAIPSPTDERSGSLRLQERWDSSSNAKIHLHLLKSGKLRNSSRNAQEKTLFERLLI